jgi:hypothetical protein
MNVAFICPECDQLVRAEVSPHEESLACMDCGGRIAVPADGFDGRHLTRCLVCPSTDLFVRKDFPQRLGVTIVTLGIIASCVAWGYHLTYITFGILFLTALVDIVLYLVVPCALMCYRCGAQYRDVRGLDAHGSFDLETHERHRQQKARLEELKAKG